MTEFLANAYIERPDIVLQEELGKLKKSEKGTKAERIKTAVNTYKISFILYVFLIAGIAVGAYFTVNTDDSLYKSLDFLFTSDISLKLDQNIYLTFVSSYASSSIFLIASFLLGFSLWGSLILPLVSLFKGFGIGITAAYLFKSYGLNGAVYYTGVILPCVFICVIALIMLQNEAFSFSAKLFFSLVKKDSIPHTILKSKAINFIKKCGACLLLTLFGSLLDVGLTLLFGNLFNF